MARAGLICCSSAIFESVKGPGGVPTSIMSFGDTGSLKHVSVGLIEIVAR